MRKIILISLYMLISIGEFQCKNYIFGKYAKIRNMYLREDEEQSGLVMNYRNHPCIRECQPNNTTTCYYYMMVHYDETFSPSCVKYLLAKYRYTVNGKEYLDENAILQNFKDEFDDCKYSDGIGKELLLVNGEFPGFNMEVCEGDTIVVDVINSLLEPTTMHWHGMLQHASPHMDGVPHVTQYPIEPGQAFRYRFIADHAGTNWWHSHTEHQRAYGLAGGLIVQQAKSKNVHAKLYDFDLADHVIMLQDWTDDFFWSVPKQLLINGHGRRNLPDPIETNRPTLYESFNVVRGGRYRFRVIYNGATNCPITLSIDQHDLLVIASDGYDITPVSVQRLSIHGGERFDFVLHANQPVDRYWLRIKGYNFCVQEKLHQEAILHYIGANTRALPKGPPLSYAYEAAGRELNPTQLSAVKTASQLSLADVNALPANIAPRGQLKTYYIEMYLNNSIPLKPIFQMDRITFDMEGISLLQTRNLGNSRLLCNKTTLAAKGMNCMLENCSCTNVIEVPAFTNIEFVVSALANAAHPLHLHGYSFHVVGMGVLGEDRISDIERIDKQTPLPRRVNNTPIKDTVQVPSYGYTILRFYTDNPGYWIFHCHISTHSEKGMTAVMRVGTAKQMKMCPVSNCGLCSSVF